MTRGGQLYTRTAWAAESKNVSEGGFVSDEPLVVRAWSTKRHRFQQNTTYDRRHFSLRLESFPLNNSGVAADMLNYTTKSTVAIEGKSPAPGLYLAWRVLSVHNRSPLTPT